MKYLVRLSLLLRDEKGLTIVEYAVAGGLIAVAAVTAFSALGGNVRDVIQSISDTLGTIPTS